MGDLAHIIEHAAPSRLADWFQSFISLIITLPSCTSALLTSLRILWPARLAWLPSMWRLQYKLSVPVGSQNAASISATDISAAISLLLSDVFSSTEARKLLAGLHVHGVENRADVLLECSRTMRSFGIRPDIEELRNVVLARGCREGRYGGGLCDIVGTGGDMHNTFNVSTTSSILASSLLLVSKHGNRSSTSNSGSADVLECIGPRPPLLGAVNAATLPAVLSVTNFAFLLAPTFHPRMKVVAAVRKSLAHPTIFNILGPLANPVEEALEARVVGVRHHDLGPQFASALLIAGVKKALIVCGEEELDEISCERRTLCWMLDEASDGSGVYIQHFSVKPEDFGLSPHSLREASLGNGPAGNARFLRAILNDEVPEGHPILDFVLINTAALFVVSGICDAESSSMGLDDDGIVIKEKGPGGRRWKEGVRRARWAIKSKAAWKQWKAYVEITEKL